MAKPHQRALALVLAVVFLATSVATGIAVVWQINQDNKTNKSAESSEQANPNTNENAPPTEEGKLQGTKLADFTPVEKVDELKVIDIKVGEGEEVKAGATVTAHYTGATASDGVIFQSSKDGGQPVEFGLDQVIAGWTEGVPGMKVGGTRRLLIPAAKAYGENPPQGSGIPPNADLVFDIEMTAVKNP